MFDVRRHSPMPFVSVIIANYNGAQWLQPCLSALRKLDYPPSRYEILVVDNGSTDQSAELIKQEFPEVRWLAHSTNNYCRAMNIAVSLAVGDYCAFLNNDTIVDSGWLVELVNVIELDPQIGACGSKILLMDGRIHSTGHRRLPDSCWTDRGFGELDRGQYDRLEEVKGLTGCAVLIRRSAFTDVGMLDEEFVIFLEDVDFSYRLRQRGWKLVYVPTSVVYHAYHGTAREEQCVYWNERNSLLLIAKQEPEKLPEALTTRRYWLYPRQPSPGVLLDLFPTLVRVLVKEHDIGTATSVIDNMTKRMVPLLNAEWELFVKSCLNGVGEAKGMLLKCQPSAEWVAFSKSETYRFVVRPLWKLLDSLKVLVHPNR